MMRAAGPIAIGAAVIIAGGAGLAAWFERQETRAAARNFTRVLHQIAHSGLQPVPIRGTRPSSALLSRGVPALLNAVAAEATSFGLELHALDEKLRAIDAGDVLSPANLTSAEGIAASRAKVRSMRALILERKRLVHMYIGRFGEVLRDAPVPDDEKRHALQGFEAMEQRILGLYRDVESAQRTVVARTSAILDFAKGNLGSATVRNGELRFSTAAQATRYNDLLEHFRQAAAAEARAMDDLAAMQKQAGREAQTALARLAE